MVEEQLVVGGPSYCVLIRLLQAAATIREHKLAGDSRRAPYKVTRPYKDSKLAVNRLYVFLREDISRKHFSFRTFPKWGKGGSTQWVVPMPEFVGPL